MVEVFKTNVEETSEANKIVALLLEHFPGSKINFDLYDCDKILRIEGKDFFIEKLIKLVHEKGFICKVLD